MGQLNVVGIKRGRQGEERLFGNNDDRNSFENYLLEFEVSRFQKLLAWLGQEVFIGDFKAEKPGYDFTHYFLYWCQIHKRYVVTYYRGYDRGLDCPDCISEYLSGIKRTRQVKENVRKQGKLRLIWSNRKKD